MRCCTQNQLDLEDEDLHQMKLIEMQNVHRFAAGHGEGVSNKNEVCEE